MALNQHAANLVDTTVNAFNGDLTSISLPDSISLIDSWVRVLKSDNQATSAIADSLLNLREELKSATPNGAHIGRIMKSLIDQTKQMTKVAETDSQPTFTTLSTALQTFSQQITDKAKRAATGSELPISSTVGANSSGRGAGISDGTGDSYTAQSGGRSQY